MSKELRDNTSIPAKLEKLRATARDPEITRRMDAWAEELRNLERFQEYAALETTQFMMEKAKGIITYCRKKLAEDRKLSDKARESLFERIDAMKWYLRMFSPEELSASAERIEESVESMLETYIAPPPVLPYKRPNLEIEAGAETSEEAYEYPSREGMPEELVSVE